MENENEKLQKIAEHLFLIKKEIDETLSLIDLKMTKSSNENMKNEDSKEYFEDDSKIIEGIFNGEIMIGPDQKQYSIPANYISKSKIVEGDKLKLTIKKDGTFIYKQIELIDRTRLTGVLTRDDGQKGYLALSEGKLYKVQKAAVTYFKGDYGDFITILVPKGKDCVWAAIENITKEKPSEVLKYKEEDLDTTEKKKEEVKEIKTEKKELSLNKVTPIKLEDLE